mmetsp:Transcript_23299/g.78915  ORF Transcript_23299/g.78915 Transcript_23299/m.78915 type:complete len:148 (-) Transcript_23299:199-642(-)
MAVDRRIKRVTSEYVKSPKQKEWEDKIVSKEQQSTKEYFAKAEARGFAAGFKARIETALDEELEEWEVTEFKGDFVRKAILKVSVGNEEFIHLVAIRPTRADKWGVRWACKGQEDVLKEDDEDYESLPDEAKCGARVEDACTACSLM